jgi:hypothetical protein
MKSVSSSKSQCAGSTGGARLRRALIFSCLLFPVSCLLVFLPSARADFQIQYFLTITNVPAGLTSNLVVNIGTSTTRYWTNDASGTPATSIQTTNTTAASATNLYSHLVNQLVYSVGSSGPSLGVDFVSSNTSMLVFTAPENTNLTVTFGGNWARGHYFTNTLTGAGTILWPTNAMSQRARTNAANSIVNLLGATNSVPINSIPPGAKFLQHYTDNVSSQNLSNKTLTGPVLSGGRLTLATNITGTNVLLTNVTLHIASITGADLTGLINLLTNGTAYNLNLINATNRGIVVALTNGIWTNGIFLKPRLTNGVNYGDAFSSPTVTAGEQFGASADASGVNSLAVGKTATSSGVESVAVGYSATASASSATALGNQANASQASTVAIGYTTTVSGENSGAFGASSIVSSNNSYAFGYDNTVTHSNTTVIGNQITSSADNLVQIGSSSQSITLAGPVVGSTLSNTTHKGSLDIDGDVAFPQSANSSIADGHNTIAAGTNVYIRLTGTPTTTWNFGGISAGNRDGKVLILQNATGYPAYFLSESGTEPTAANRILTYSRTNIYWPTNGIAQLIYDTTASRWQLFGNSIAGPRTVLSGSTNFDFGSISVLNTALIMIPVEGATTNDIPQVSFPPQVFTSGTLCTNIAVWTWATNNLVGVRFINNSTNAACNPAAGTFSAVIERY